MKKQTWLDIINTCIAIATLVATIYIGSTSNEIANNIVERDKKQVSKDYLSNFHSTIMNSQDFYQIWRYIDEEKKIPNDAKKASFIDNFEGIGEKYCDSLIYLRDLKTYKYLFEKVCLNSEIINIFKNKKNGFSKVCVDVIGENGMGLYYRHNDTCKVLK